MKIAHKNKFHFANLPRDYVELCRLHLPRPIHDKVEYENMLEIAEAFAGFEDGMTKDQDDYFDLLCALISTWEGAHVKWRNLPPLKTLRHLLDERGMTAADLSRSFGLSRPLAAMILRGERSITADHARKFGAHFGVPAGAFIE